MSFEADFAKVVNSDEVLEWSRKSGFVKRLRCFHPFRFLITLSFGCMSGLWATLDSQARYQLKPMTRQALHRRFNREAVEFVRHWFGVIVKRIVDFSRPKVEVDLLASFRRVYLADSSSWDLPENLRTLFPGCGGDASGANCKLLLVYEYLTGLFRLTRLLPGKEPDTKHGQSLLEELEARDLILFDAGFFALGVLRKIAERGACFVCRFVPSASVWLRSEGGELERVSLASYLTNCAKDAVEMTATLGIQPDKQVECRLVAFRVPEEVANRRRQKLRRREVRQKGHHRTSRDTLALCDWNVFMTKAPEGMLPGFMLRSVYRLRWQIELVFKQMKSVLRINECTTQKQERFLCQTYAKLIGAMLVHVLHAKATSLAWEQKGAEISFDKMWKRVQEKSDSLCRAYFRNCRTVAREIRDLIGLALKNCRKNRDQSKPTTLERLLKQQGDQAPVAVTYSEIMASLAVAA